MSELSTQTKYNYGAAHTHTHETAAAASTAKSNNTIFIMIGAVLLIVVIIYLYMQHTKKSKGPPALTPTVSCTVKPCAAPEICEPNSGSCLSCMQDPALCTGAASACDPIKGCVAPCTQTGIGACESGYTCNATSSLCLKTCDDANSCGFGQTCIQGECELISCADNDIPCPKGQKCALGLIPDLAHCVNIPCNQAGATPCAKGLYCDVKNGLCSSAPLCLLGPILSKCPPEFPICYKSQCMATIPCVVGGTDPSQWCPTGATPYCTNGICGVAPSCTNQLNVNGCPVGEYCVTPSDTTTIGVCTQNIPTNAVGNYQLLTGYKVIDTAKIIHSYPYTCAIMGVPPQDQMVTLLAMADEIGEGGDETCSDCHMGSIEMAGSACASLPDFTTANYYGDAPLTANPLFYTLTNSGGY